MSYSSTVHRFRITIVVNPLGINEGREPLNEILLCLYDGTRFLENTLINDMTFLRCAISADTVRHIPSSPPHRS
jgi:hypothetical protein